MDYKTEDVGEPIKPHKMPKMQNKYTIKIYQIKKLT